jgi:hypothetical protein
MRYLWGASKSLVSCWSSVSSKSFYILAAGPANTPYEGGCFLFDFYFPPTYPTAPPQVNLRTTGVPCRTHAPPPATRMPTPLSLYIGSLSGSLCLQNVCVHPCSCIHLLCHAPCWIEAPSLSFERLGASLVFFFFCFYLPPTHHLEPHNTHRHLCPCIPPLNLLMLCLHNVRGCGALQADLDCGCACRWRTGAVQSEPVQLREGVPVTAGHLERWPGRGLGCTLLLSTSGGQFAGGQNAHTPPIFVVLPDMKTAKQCREADLSPNSGAHSPDSPNAGKHSLQISECIIGCMACLAQAGNVARENVECPF